MKNILITLSFLFLLSCSEKQEEAENKLQNPDSSKTEVTVKDSFPEILKPLMIARGSEPGWYAEFYWDSAAISLDHDEIKLNLKHDFSKLDVSEFKTEVTTKESPKEKIQILVKQEACTEEASGEKRERSILLKYKSKEYKCCATVQL
jgi:uncharacterized membrane protein